MTFVRSNVRAEPRVPTPAETAQGPGTGGVLATRLRRSCLAKSTTYAIGSWRGIRLLDPRRGRGARRGAEELSRGGIAEVTAWLNVNDSNIGLRVTLSSLGGGRRNDELVSIE